jgi:hypothetical protein
MYKKNPTSFGVGLKVDTFLNITKHPTV